MGVRKNDFPCRRTATLLHDDRGLVLVIVLWVLAILVVLAWGLAATVQTEARLVSNYTEAARCLEYARAGIAMTSKRLSEADLSTVTQKEPPSSIDSDDEGLPFQGGGGFGVNIEDEAGKLNLNTATLEMLITLTNDPDLAASIMAWRSSGNTSSTAGAEDSYYMGLPDPYHCKKAPFETPDELLLVKGMTQERFTESVAGRTPLARLLTVYSVDENVDRQGRLRLNLNTASESDLRSRLEDVLTNQEISAIVSYRSNSRSGQGTSSPSGGPASPSGPANPQGQNAQPGRPNASASQPGGGGSTNRSFQSVGDLLEVPGLSRDKVRQMVDRVTVNDDRTTPGRVNLNTAEETVLASLPGLTDSIAQDIIEYRDEGHGAFADVGELLEVKSVTNEVYRRVADRITVRSTAFRITSTGRLRDSKTTRSVECVVSLLRSDLKATAPATANQPTANRPTASQGPQSRTPQLQYWRQGA